MCGLAAADRGEMKEMSSVLMEGMFGNWDLDSINKMGIMH